MNQEEFSELIKKIRKDNNLTQKELADSLFVTYQAISKWENGKSMPDMVMMKTICEKYHIDLNSNNKKKNKILICIIIGLITLIIIGIIITLSNKKNNDYEFRTISSTCSAFKISGSAAYSKDNSSIYISSIDYCGGNDEIEYDSISCSLNYKINNNIMVIAEDNGNNKTTLVNYLKNVSFNVGKSCPTLDNAEIYLEINANKNNNITTYKVPLKLTPNCN